MKTYDTVVIGAGAIGTSVAYHLTQKGYKVALIDHGDVASGSSSHCDAVALICDKEPGIDTKMGQASIDMYADISQKFDFDFEYDAKGCLYVCETEPEMVAAERYVKAQQADGYEMKLVDNKEFCEMEPYISKSIAGGIYTSPKGAVSLSPYKLCFAYVEEAKKKGLDVYSYCNIQAINLNTTTNAVESLDTDQGKIYANKIVNCGGVWAPDIGKLVGIDIPIQPRKGMNLISEKVKKIVNHKLLEFGYMMSKFDDINFTRNVSPLVEEYNVAFNLEYTSDHNLLVGGYRGFRGFDSRSEIEAMKAISERAIQFFPCLKDINCIRSYAGVRPFVEDHMPIVSDVDSVPGFYIAAGHEGDGICFSPITGHFMTQIISGEKTDFDISALDYSRFANKRA